MQKSQSVRGPVRLRASGDNELPAARVTVKTAIHVCLGAGPYLGQGKEQLEAGEKPS